MNSKNKLPLIISLVIVASILALAGAYGAGIFKNNTSSMSTTNDNGNKDIVSYAIDMNNYSFSPNLIAAEPGETLKVKITSHNGNHDLKIDAFKFDSGVLENGQSKIFEIKVPIDAKGEYEFYCSIGNHKAMGMVGKFQIKDSGSQSMNTSDQIKDDQSFIEAMIPHHQEAISNSQIIIVNSQNTDLKSFAQKVVNAQTSEVNQMKSWYRQWFGKDYQDNGAYKNMMSDMMGKSGNEEDIIYAKGMILHHQAAIQMAEKIKTITTRTEIINFTNNIISVQTQEISNLQTILKK